VTERDPDVSELYDRWSATYDSDLNATRDLDAIVLREAGLPVTGRDVCELGCGTGKNTEWLAERASRVLALDFSAGMLAIARSRIASDRVTFRLHDITEPWPAPDASFDAVIGNLVLEHISSVERVFAEAARVLREGGVLFLAELHPYRQLTGSQAHFTETQSGDTLHVPAFVHSTGEFVNAGIDAGLQLRRLGEHLESGAKSGVPPRLLSLLFEKPIALATRSATP
jgi:malonyl-CoA O-methyltransferase